MTNRPIRRFSELLGLLDGGKFESACDLALTEALGSLEEMPKDKGKATITITLEVDYDGGRVDVHPVLKSKLPEGQAFGRTPLWVHDGALSTQHPSQINMFPTAAPEPKAAVAGE